MAYGILHEVVLKLYDGTFGPEAAAVSIVGIVVLHVMGQVGAYQDEVPRLEAFHIVADESGSGALFEVDDFIFGVEMPRISKVGIIVETGFDGR